MSNPKATNLKLIDGFEHLNVFLTQTEKVYIKYLLRLVLAIFVFSFCI